MKVQVLSSGSSGNCTYAEMGGARFLIDIGISCRKTEQLLTAIGVSPDTIDAVFITHEHIDHVRGLSRFAARHPTEVYCNEGTAAVLERMFMHEGIPVPPFVIFESRVPFMLGRLLVTPVRISHDTAEPVAYTFDDTDADEKLGLFTDLGFVSDEVSQALGTCSALVLESNHDPDMLKNSGRPYTLVTRIAGTSGHLSNEQACQAVATVCPPCLRYIVLAHLSSECNDPTLARAMMTATLKHIGRGDIRVDVASKNSPTEPFEH